MLNKLIRYYNQNKKVIWIFIIFVAFFIILLQGITYLTRQNKQQKYENLLNNDNNKTNNTNIQSNNENINNNPNPNTNSSNTRNKINEFVNYCSNNQINEAYSLLSEDCKEEMYPSVEDFRKNYYNNIFSGKKKNVLIENWSKNVYKVKYMEDALSTGIYNTKNSIQDYITLITDREGNTKLNINSYIGKKEINVEIKRYEIELKVIEKHSYMDYEIYDFEITNKSNAEILLNDKNNTDTMYLQDANEIKYLAYTHEIPEAQFKIALNETKKVSIKYYNKYSSNKIIKNIVFGKIILNYNAYVNYQNPGYYNEYGVIQINL